MPGKVKVKILAGRNLPVMDRGSDTTDAYVEIKFLNITHKTDVCRKSLNPQWNSDWYRFEVDDAELQDEPLQIRLMDHDTYSANDAIGKVNISLNPLLLLPIDTSHTTGKGSVMSGWIPVFDTMHGIRGEVNLIVKVDLFSDLNRFRQSSCGIQFFHSPIIPHGYYAQIIHGFVEELVVNDDPEYQWIDKIRTPRASNEARQVVFLKLSGQVQRKIGLKAIDLGANAVIGYTQCFDLEGDVGVVARGIGTAVTLVKIHDFCPPPIVDSALMEERTKQYFNFISSNMDGKSIFDTENDPLQSGDIVYKILGIDPDSKTTRMPNIVFTRKESEKLKYLLEQEEMRGEKVGGLKKNINKIRKKVSALKSRISRDDSTDLDDLSRTTSVSDVSRSSFSETPSIRSSFTDLRRIANQIKRTSKFPRSSSDGSSMANLLVKSLMITTGQELDCIKENHDSPGSSPSNSILRADCKKSESLREITVHEKPLKMGSSLGDTIFLAPTFGISESNLSINQSISTSDSCESDDEDDDGDISEDFSLRDTLMVDPETVSMVVKSVLARELNIDGNCDWIEPGSTIKYPEVRLSRQGSKIVRTGSARILKLEGTQLHENVNDMNQEDLDKMLNSVSDDVIWIKPGSTVDEPEVFNTSRRGSLLQDLKDNISDTFHNIQDHMHMPHISSKPHEPGLFRTAMETMLIEKAGLLGAQRDKDTSQNEKFPEVRLSREGSTIVRTGSARILKLEGTQLHENENEMNQEDLDKMLYSVSDDVIWIKPGSTNDEPEVLEKPRRGSLLNDIKDTFHNIQEHMHMPHMSSKPHEPGLLRSAMETMLIEKAGILGAQSGENNTQQNEKTISKMDSFKKRFSVNFEKGFFSRRSSKDSIKSVDSVRSESAIKNMSGMIGTAMKTILMDKANIMEDIISEDQKVYESSVPSSSDNLIQTSSSNSNSVELVSSKSRTPTPNQISIVISEESNKASDFIETNNMPLHATSFSPKNRLETAMSPANKQSGHVRAESIGCKMSQSPAKILNASIPSNGGKELSAAIGICRRSSDSDLSVTPKENSISESPYIPRGRTNSNFHRGNSLTSGDRMTQNPNVRMVALSTVRPPINQENLDMLEYPFLTMAKYPPGFILHLGATVCARSVKLLERVPNPDEPETRDSWWTELRMEIRSHARALACNVVLGYSEVTTISDEVCVLSATGTAAVINLHYTGELPILDNSIITKNINSKEIMTTSLDRQEFENGKDIKNANSIKIIDETKTELETDLNSSSTQNKENNQNIINATPPPKNLPKSNCTNCSLCHIPYSQTSVPFRINMKKCAVCKKGKVPDVLLATIEIPDNIQITGRGCLLQAQVCRAKKDLRAESNAKEISDGLPFLEYDLHRLLINKLKIKGMNAIFGLKATVAVGERMMTLIATGTAVFLTSLPSPAVPKIVAGNSWNDSDKLSEIQKSLQETVDRNREIYQLKPTLEQEFNGKCITSDTEDSDDEIAEVDFNFGNKGACVLEVDDIEDLEIIASLMEPCPPDGFHVVNSQSVPGLHDMEVVKNLQMFIHVWRAKMTTNQMNSSFSKHFNRLLQSIYYKLRSMVPCAICDLRFRLDLPETDEIQIVVTGMALGLGDLKLNKFKRKMNHSTSKDGIRKFDDDLIFSLEEDIEKEISHTPTMAASNVSFPYYSSQATSIKNRSKSPSRCRFGSARHVNLNRHMPLRERYGVDITPLSYVPGGKIEKYLGNLNFFLIRESTSVRENGGISGFVHSFITELLAIVRAHVTALGGNAMVSFYMTEIYLVDNPHKNQGQCVISVGGDVVFVSYFPDD